MGLVAQYKGLQATPTLMETSRHESTAQIKRGDRAREEKQREEERGEGKGEEIKGGGKEGRGEAGRRR